MGVEFVGNLLELVSHYIDHLERQEDQCNEDLNKSSCELDSRIDRLAVRFHSRLCRVDDEHDHCRDHASTEDDESSSSEDSSEDSRDCSRECQRRQFLVGEEHSDRRVRFRELVFDEAARNG